MTRSSLQRRAQRVVTSRVSVHATEVKKRAEKLVTQVKALSKKKGVLDPKDTIELQKTLRAILAVSISASNSLKAI